MEKGAISRDDILRTLQEYDELGGEEFRDLYGFGEARDYLLLYEGREYDSKAIAGVAHKHRHGRPLTSSEFSGGVAHAVEWLKREGFAIGAPRNPKWTRDELILACDIVARNGWQGLDAGDPRIAELSGLLQLLGAYPEEERASTYRNRNGPHVRRSTSPRTTRTIRRSPPTAESWTSKSCTTSWTARLRWRRLLSSFATG